MSVWIRKTGQTGRWIYLSELPVLLVIPLFAIAMSVLISSMAAAPVWTLLVCFAVAATGAVFVATAKWSLIRRGIVVSFGSAKMSKGMNVLYRVGWFLVIAGTAVGLLAISFVLRCG
jgi:hypothetical protein